MLTQPRKRENSMLQRWGLGEGEVVPFAGLGRQMGVVREYSCSRPIG